MLKQKPIHVCNTCGKEIPGKTGIYCHDVPNEGSSDIEHNGKTFSVDENKDYCNMKCLIADIEKSLGLKHEVF